MAFEPLPRLSDHEHGPKLVADLEAVGARTAMASLTNRFGVRLLHEHWPSEGGTVVEWAEGPALATRAATEQEAMGLATTNWAFWPNGTAVPIQRSRDYLSDQDGAHDLELQQFGALLASAGLTRVFAAIELQRTVIPAAGYILTETTDEVARTQYSVPTPLSAVPSQQLAGWAFSNQGGVIPMYGCQGMPHN